MILIMEYWWWHADRKTKAPAPLPTMIWAMSKTIKKEYSSYNFSWFELRKLKANHGDETHSLSSEFTKGKSSKHARKIHQVARYEYTRFTRQEFTSFVHSRHKVYVFQKGGFDCSTSSLVGYLADLLWQQQVASDHWSLSGLVYAMPISFNAITNYVNCFHQCWFQQQYEHERITPTIFTQVL